MKKLFKDRNRLLCQALRENKKKAKNRMRDDAGGRCCLCVARDVAIENGLALPEECPEKLPEQEVADWYGWDFKVPYLETPDEGLISATSLNDGCDTKERSHKTIASYFEATFKL